MEKLHELQMPESTPPPGPRSRSRKKGGGGKWVVLLLVLSAVGAGVWHWRRSKTPAPVAAEPEVAEAEAEKEVVDAGAADAGLDPSSGDEELRALLPELSPSPKLGEWFERSRIRSFVAAANLVADGESPSPVVGFLAPGTPFTIKRIKRKWYVDPKSYTRYDPMVKVVQSVNPEAVARVYFRLRPFFDAAYQEIAKPDRTFDQTLLAAIDHLLAAPVPKGKLQVRQEGLVYKYVDEKLEGKSPAQKHLMRLGPKNMKAVQKKLQMFKAALETAKPNP